MLVERSILVDLPTHQGKPLLPLAGVRIEHLFKRGQLSEGFLGHHIGLEVPVVVRIMKPSIKEQLGEQAIHELVACCRQYARVRHASITGIYDVGAIQNHGYTVIEYVSGVPLVERIKERPLSEQQAVKIMWHIADGLMALWKIDYVHRGVSPLRIIVDNEGTPKLDIVVLPRTPLNPLLIEAHAPFMAGFWPPEELRQSAEIDERSDMFSFGASMYFALTGRSPFGKGSKTELIARTLTDVPVEPRTLVPELNPELNRFLMRCLQREPKDRFTSTQEFFEALLSIKLNICVPQTARPSTFSPVVQVPETIGGSSPSSEAEPFKVGDIVGQCRLDKMIGAGSFGVVFKAQHLLLDIPVAVKFLPRELAERHPEYISLFLREARTAIRIRHKHIIGLYEAGHQNGQYYLIMEYAPGGSVQEKAVQSNGSLSHREVVRIMRETALGLSAAEEMGVVHRDIKPANLMFGAQGEVKIADLGLAKRLARPSERNDEIQASIQKEQLTMWRGDNSIQGTPAYIAPEAALKPESVDHRSDQYSLGVTAYQLLSGRLPFDGVDPLQVMMKHLTQPIPPLAQGEAKFPTELEGIVTRLMAKQPDGRYPSALELVKALETVPA